MSRPATPGNDWSGRFRIGTGFALYQGPGGDNTPHRHAAFQVAIALRGRLELDDGTRRHRGTAFVIPPHLRHRQLPVAQLRCIYVEPHCRLADALRACCGPGITAAPALRALDERRLDRFGAQDSGALDARLRQAMALLADLAPAPSLPQIARSVGLSPPRLRALAHAQLGMPLARWRLWQRLRRAAAALAEGRSLADAAHAAGFADQAHFGRQMREMFGVAPGAVLPLLRAQGLAAT
ncbi:cupin domain-containing protein [Luteimonas aquatica]|uniref:cupin domain-containing protein n=1 Tax=Luteimonas aquatica TaxID=450364 RepID=UPI001F593A5D|nr:cupin domain-containing protein [Luteimonas aquatica]